MRTKICGITNLEDALAAAEAGADFLGLILAESKRQISVDKANHILAALPAGARPVLLFKDQPLEEVFDAIDKTDVGWIQLHGKETPDFIRAIHGHFPDVHVIRAWEVTDDFADTPKLKAYLQQCREIAARIDVIILDVPKGGKHPGYAVLASVAKQISPLDYEVWCAGGLNVDNVEEAASHGGFAGVDVASGVESEPGVKDHRLVKRFVEIAESLKLVSAGKGS